MVGRWDVEQVFDENGDELIGSNIDCFKESYLVLDGTGTGDFYAYEIAICVNAWCFEPSNNEFNPTKAKLLLKSYNNVREFSIEEIEALPMLTRASALRYLLTRLIDYFSHDDNDLILKKDPAEYLAKLKFHQTVKRPSEYGL